MNVFSVLVKYDFCFVDPCIYSVVLTLILYLTVLKQISHFYECCAFLLLQLSMVIIFTGQMGFVVLEVND